MNDYIFSKNIILNIYVDILFQKINIDINIFCTNVSTPCFYVW